MIPHRLNTWTLIYSLTFSPLAFGESDPGAPPAAAQICATAGTQEVAALRREYEEGLSHLNDKNYGEAIRVFRAGVARLGSEYVLSSAIDDTGQRLVLANVEERKGRFSVAAHLLNGVLSTRLSMCERKVADRPTSAVPPLEVR